VNCDGDGKFTVMDFLSFMMMISRVFIQDVIIMQQRLKEENQ
jgi:hypothetical protein